VKNPDNNIEMKDESETGLDLINPKYDTAFGVTSYVAAVVCLPNFTPIP
jgi:hypothetical protein